MDGTNDVFKLEEIYVNETDYRAKSSGEEQVKSSSLEEEHKVFHNFDNDFRVKDEVLSMERGDSSSYNTKSHNDFDESVGECEESDDTVTVPKKEATARQKFRRWRHKEYQCDECDRMFTLKHNLQNHFLQYHMGCKTLHKACASCKCTICGKIYSAASVLAEHMLNEHEKYVDREECRICHEKFVTTTALMKHMREHNRVWKTCPRVGCEDLKFKYIKELNEHIRVKHKAEELACSQCNMVFRQLSAKIKHEEKHDRERKDAEDFQRRTQKAKCDEDLVKREPQSPPTLLLKHRRPTFHPEIEAVPIKKKTPKRLTKEEILAKIK